MANIQKRTRADGQAVYVVRWRNPDGGHHSLGGFRTKKAAESFAGTEIEPRLRRGVAFDPNRGKVLFRDAAAQWLNSRHDLKESTRAAYAEALAPTAGATAKRHGMHKDLRIDAVFGSWPLEKISRSYISEWVSRMNAAGKKPSTIRNAYFLVKQILGQAVQDGRLDANPADYVKLPTAHNTGTSTALDDPNLFLSAGQVSALVSATPWPYAVMVHVAAWSGLRSGELEGLQVGDIDVAAPNRPGSLRVERTVARVGKELKYLTPKTRGSRRTVPLTPQTTTLLREYLSQHPRRDEPTAPLFPAVQLTKQKPTGVRAEVPAKSAKERAERQLSALAALSVDDAEARLVLDWTQPLRHSTFSKAVFSPSVRRANRLYPAVSLPTTTHPHTLRHTYASLCVAAGLPMFEISRFMGHAKPSTTETVYAHLLRDDHSSAMAALGSMEAAPAQAANVIPLRG
ncbi:hypothetical protein MMUR_23790 [Mycolicibacterium murale]|uniref:Tyr recombinase domain-containing protein n=1 Tax=Mycolicibacterium murale TaxID=182220 RepID=A0A7I9WKR2_9MYCO|nr:site-specific integrase [Mycolicibacterium murale]MCV7185426.1 site-specific integrase [Mycolicibacterium murale]GFG58243.1 hypothetical protein MMUR_23790 [Mycolicibacterium murale]